MKERITKEDFHANLQASEYEKDDRNLLRILKNSYNDLEVALNHWHSWVVFRHGKCYYNKLTKIIIIFIIIILIIIIIRRRNKLN
jgi:hypothetical protein